MDLDIILDEIGAFGKFQIINYALVLIPVGFSAFITMSYIFTAGDLKYRCLVPECENASSTEFLPYWLSNAIPMKSKDTPSNCKRYATRMGPYDLNDNETCSAEQFLQTQTVACNKWVFETDENTVTKEFGILCDENQWKRTFIGSQNNIAMFVGVPLLGIFSDRLGRKTVLVFASITSTAMGILRSFATNYYVFLIFESVDAFFCDYYTAGFVIAMEIVGPSHRVLGCTLINLAFATGETIVGLVMWWVQDWRIMLRVLYVPGILFISYYWLVPESIRWLIANKRQAEAISLIRLIAKRNGRSMPIEIEEKVYEMSKKGDVQSSEPKRKQKHALIKVFNSKRLLLRLVSCTFCWITNTFVYYGLSLNSVSIAGNKYLNYVLVCLVEMPAYIAMLVMLNFLGRRSTLASMFLVSGMACLCFHFMDEDMFLTRLTLYMLGKFAITISFALIYLYTAEMFPTELRQSIIGTCSMFARVGSALAPQTPLLAFYIDPMVVFGVFAMLAGGLALLFPETKDIKLPDTVEQAEILGVRKDES